MGIMEEERDRTNTYETIITENFPKSMSDTKPLIKEKINSSVHRWYDLPKKKVQIK